MDISKILNYKKLFILILFFLFLTNLFPQKRKRLKELPRKSPIYFETHITTNDSSAYTCFISFKISYNNLLFIKRGGKFQSGISISYEISKDGKYSTRVFDKKTFSVLDYKTTVDSKLFLEGVTSFKVRKGEIKIAPSIQLANTDIEFKSKPLKLVIDSVQISEPIVIYENLVCDSMSYRIANSQNVIPFSEQRYDLLIPIYLNDDSDLKVEIEQRDNVVVKKNISEFILLNKKFSECNNKIIISKKNYQKDVKYYHFKYINKDLTEGPINIKVQHGKTKMNFYMNLFWDEKPKSLSNIEDAIEAMELIGLSNVADSLSDFSDDEAYVALFNYWKKFDDSKSTMFNEVFNEFYSRIDYVNEEFNSLGNNNGLDTDRGKTYLIYGKPDKIERNYSEIYNVVEVWTYSEINQKIRFSDKTGTGNFERIK